MDEENNDIELLNTIDNVYIDENMTLDSQNIPEMSDEEADDREYEKILENDEGGL